MCGFPNDQGACVRWMVVVVVNVALAVDAAVVVVAAAAGDDDDERNITYLVQVPTSVSVT